MCSCVTLLSTPPQGAATPRNSLLLLTCCRLVTTRHGSFFTSFSAFSFFISSPSIESSMLLTMKSQLVVVFRIQIYKNRRLMNHSKSNHFCSDDVCYACKSIMQPIIYTAGKRCSLMHFVKTQYLNTNKIK